MPRSRNYAFEECAILLLNCSLTFHWLGGFSNHCLSQYCNIIKIKLLKCRYVYFSGGDIVADFVYSSEHWHRWVGLLLFVSWSCSLVKMPSRWLAIFSGCLFFEAICLVEWKKHNNKRSDILRVLKTSRAKEGINPLNDHGYHSMIFFHTYTTCYIIFFSDYGQFVVNMCA